MIAGVDCISTTGKFVFAVTLFEPKSLFKNELLEYDGCRSPYPEDNRSETAEPLSLDAEIDCRSVVKLCNNAIVYFKHVHDTKNSNSTTIIILRQLNVKRNKLVLTIGSSFQVTGGVAAYRIVQRNIDKSKKKKNKR